LTVVVLQGCILWEYMRARRIDNVDEDVAAIMADERAVAVPVVAGQGRRGPDRVAHRETLVPVARRMNREMSRFVRSPLDELRMLEALFDRDADWTGLAVAHAMDMQVDDAVCVWMIGC
jgi:hypothetical protein